MCGRYMITSAPEAMRQLFDWFEKPNFPPRHNIAPTQPVPIVILDGGKRRFMLVRWGLVPSWAKEMPQSLLINARAETIAEKPSFRGSFRHRRALMPADGFYEWKAEGKGPKQPYVIRRVDRAPFAMAALWDNWMPADGSEIDSCAVVTCEANETLSPVHHRMPVILDQKDWEKWLDPATPPKELQALMRPAPADLLDAQPVSTRINRVANDDPGLLDPVVKTAEPPPEKPRAKKPAKDTRQMGLF
ncbi:SOS response-associated peptidase [Parvibaculum sp.]|uniref:SOS response-associated peptidase n=1 Tax=Parvibaculum sp. TaxID=2024848 RepID=UPI001D93BBC0|nr:SOS response-associated peptidase [Parvibaculum sp.]MBX3490581.1 SOS response-associated peptidase [Parvibaculum sp.]MCW5728439.1 SOS response-associated peptidase [Parvibaculum sp.]